MWKYNFGKAVRDLAMKWKANFVERSLHPFPRYAALFFRGFMPRVVDIENLSDKTGDFRLLARKWDECVRACVRANKRCN